VVVLRVGHSLGAKLHALNLACGRYPLSEPLALIAFNNFGIGESAGLALSFAEAFAGGGGGLGGGGGEAGRGGTSSVSGGGGGDAPGLDTASFRALADLAAVVTASLGVEFSPSPDVTRALLARLADEAAGSDSSGLSVRAFRFDGDALDSTGDLAPLLQAPSVEPPPRPSRGQGRGGGATTLPGTHLAPVYLHASVRDLVTSSVAPVSSVDPRAVAAVLESGLVDEQGAISFGDEGALNALVASLAQWARQHIGGV
jgi:hypothetical protein